MAAVPAAGVAVLVTAVIDLALSPPPLTWIALAALTLLTGSFTVKIPGLVARLSVSEPFVFASTLLFGPSAGAITAALDALVMSFWLLPNLKTLHRLLFNVSVLVVSIWASSQLFFTLAGLDPRAPDYSSLGEFIVPLYVFALSCFLINSWLVAFALAYERKQSALQIWRSQFLWLSVNYFSGASVAALIVVYAKTISPAVLVIVLPLLAISYLTFRTTLGRLEDTNQHLAELNQLYLSTIETLAMAVDAKDQVTHGHIRRVQRYAVGLAKELGVSDRNQLKALEAAALLHDMGKLAIPEYILNKPGRLTPGEFEKMKLHAGIGADILSAIRFPYPVVPIVRHHHENWDGTGYPGSLKGTDIPIGARILSVVDCFDALTSDRPYRPALDTNAAFGVILERRGSMYDPLVVDSFIRCYPQLSEGMADVEASPETIQAIARLNSVRNSGDGAAEPATPSGGGTDVVLPLLSLLDSLPREFDPNDLAALLIARLGGTISVDACVVYLVGPSGEEVVVAGRAGQVPAGFGGTSITFGSRIAGWVAATRTPVRNSDPVLDFGVSNEKMASALSVPLMLGETLMGVLSLYSKDQQAYSVEHQRLIELLGTRIADVYGAKTQTTKYVTVEVRKPEGWPGWLELERFLLSHPGTLKNWSPIGLVSIVREGMSAPLFEPFAEEARSVVRLGDLAFRLSEAEVLLVLPRSGGDAVQAVVRRLEESLGTMPDGRGVRVRSTSCETGELLISAVRRVREHAGGVSPTLDGSDTVH
jgi:putative nucleotidyltransferase with HDIG domain